MKELENEVDLLKMQLEDAGKQGQQTKSQSSNAAKFGQNIKKDLNQDEQRQLQIEIQQLDQIVKGYQDENIKAVSKQKDLESTLNQLKK